MNKYQVIMEIWKARGAFDPSEKDFFECACCNPSGVDAEEENNYEKDHQK